MSCILDPTLAWSQSRSSQPSVNAMLRVDTGLLSVQVKKSTHLYLSQKKVKTQSGTSQLGTTSVDQNPKSISIVIFTGEQILKSRECGDQQCLLKLSNAEVHQVMSQNLHTNLPQKTEDNDAAIGLVGPIPTIKIGLVNSPKLSSLLTNQSRVNESAVSIKDIFC